MLILMLYYEYHIILLYQFIINVYGIVLSFLIAVIVVILVKIIIVIFSFFSLLILVNVTFGH